MKNNKWQKFTGIVCSCHPTVWIDVIFIDGEEIEDFPANANIDWLLVKYWRVKTSKAWCKRKEH